jgi:hypothetical protein
MNLGAGAAVEEAAVAEVEARPELELAGLGLVGRLMR